MSQTSNPSVCPICKDTRFRPYKLGLVQCESCTVVLSPAIWQPQANETMEDEWFGEDYQAESSVWVNVFQAWNNRKALIRYAPPGVDAERFQPAATRDLRSDPYILCVGRLDDPRKNIGLLLEAYAFLPAALQQTARLVLAGSAGPGPDFWARAKELGVTDRVDFILSPDSEALVGLYQAAAVFALSLDEEGLGVVILEAMACAVPVISTRSGGPDGIITEGQDGFLVGLEDTQALADRLARLLSDEALNRRMGQAARGTILQRYETDVTGQAFLDIYEELLSRYQR